MDATRSAIAERGFDSVTLRDVARRAGVSVAAPYRHFADKAELLAAVAAEGFEALHRAIMEAVAQTPPGATARDRLQTAASAYVRFALDHPTWFDAMFRPEGQSAPTPALDASGSKAFAVLANGVAACQAERSIRPGDPLDLALAAWSLIHGLATLLRARDVPGQRSPEALVERVGVLLFEGIGFQSPRDGSSETSRPVAALAVVRRADGKVLLVRRSMAIPGAGHWVPPGGKPEPGESLAAAAGRETEEETGLSVTVGDELHRCPSSDDRYELVWFDARPVDPAAAHAPLEPQAEEVASAAWFDLDQLRTLEPMFTATRLFFAGLTRAAAD